MVTSAPVSTPSSLSFTDQLRRDPGFAAFWVLRAGFVVLPLLMGLDKFTNLLTDWPGYLAPGSRHSCPSPRRPRCMSSA